MCLWSTQAGPDVKAALERLFRVEAALSSALEQDGHCFAWSPEMGHLTTCPSKGGTALRVEISAKLQLLSTRPNFRQLCRALHLQAKALGASQPGMWEISSADKSPSVTEQVNSLLAGLAQLVDWESRLSDGEQVD